MITEPARRGVGRGFAVAKDKKKKKSGKKVGGAPKAKATKAAKRLESLARNPLVAEIVAAALVATAAALKNPDKARQLASQAGDELNALAKAGSERGNAMWQLALDIGRRSLDALAGDDTPKGKSARKPK
jgi:hypothetical protein